MPSDNIASATKFSHQIFQGSTWHSRLLPSLHKFVYPYRYWGVNITALARGQALPEVAAVQDSDHKIKRLPFINLLAKALPVFSAEHRALQQFYADDYLQQAAHSDDRVYHDPSNFNISDDDKGKSANNDIQALQLRVEQAFIQHTGSAPVGDVIGLVVCRNLGLYFSPVNFYIGFDTAQTPTHLLAEVSNTPWNKRHYYGLLLDGIDTEYCHDKNFHVSPFNPIDQCYRWRVRVQQDQADNLQVRIAIDISDRRGTVLKTGVTMSGTPMTHAAIRRSLQQNPFMNMTSLSRIYWQAFKLYAIKKVPYINYDEKLVDSEQNQS